MMNLHERCGSLKIGFFLFLFVLWASSAPAAIIGYDSREEVLRDALILALQIRTCVQTDSTVQCAGVPAKCVQFKAKWMATDLKVQRQAMDEYERLDGLCNDVFKALSGKEPDSVRRQRERESASDRTESRQSQSSSQTANLPSTYTNSIGMEFVRIPEGSFTMGDDKDSDSPRHRVTISRPFYLGKYEVTQAQWQAVMGENPSEFKGWTRPVENVSYEDVKKFIRKLNQKEGTSGYRLPTEAEWEYAARAGSTTTYCFGNDETQLKYYAWYWDNAEKQTHPVGEKRANAWGLYDMHGNVYEWCQDWYADWYYGASPSADPQGPDSGKYRVLRGGGWDILARYCRSAYRCDYSPVSRGENFGFRLAFSPGQQ